MLAALFELTVLLDRCVAVLLLETDTFVLPIFVAILLLLAVVALLLRLTLTFVLLMVPFCVPIPVLVLLTVDRETVGVERLTVMLGRLITLCVLMFVDTGALVFTDLFVLTVLLFVLLTFVRGCIVVLVVLTLPLLTFDVLADRFDVTLLLLLLDCFVTPVCLELAEELLLAGREELVALCVLLLCLWLLFCEELLLLPLDFPLSFAKVLSAKINIIIIIITEANLIIFVFLANIILLLSLTLRFFSLIPIIIL